MPADWEPAPPSARLRGYYGELCTAMARLDELRARVLRITSAILETEDDVAAMERRLAEYARKERADAE